MGRKAASGATMSTRTHKSLEGKDSISAEDRREFPRVSSRCIVDYKQVGNDPSFQVLQQASQGLMQNISGGGVCVRMPSNPGLGSLLALNIALPMFPTSVIALGKVSWVDALEDGHADVGIEFWWVGWHDASAQEQIRHYITEKLDSPADIADASAKSLK